MSSSTATEAPAHRASRDTNRENRLARLLRTRPFLISALVVVLGAFSLNFAHVQVHTELSPVDELQHIDYLYKAPTVVHSGERVGQEAMHEQACRTLPSWPTDLPCTDDAVYDPDDFQEKGTNSAAIYTPFYYTVTRAIATPLQAVTGMDSLVTAGRMVGGLWLAGGLVMTLLVARRLGAHPYPAAALLLAAASAPTVLTSSASITPDAAALLAGASLVWSVLWWRESPRRRWWLPTLLSAGAVALKALNILVVVLVALFILLRAVVGAVSRRRADRDDDPAPTMGQSLLCISAMSVVALAGAVGYIMFTSATAVASSEGVSMADRIRATTFPLQQTIEHIGVFLDVFYNAGWWNTIGWVGELTQSLVGLFTFGGVFAAAMVVRRLSRDARLLAVALLVVGLVGAPMIIVFSYLSQGMFVPIPGRYGLTLIPVGVALASSVITGRVARVVTGVFGAGCFVATLGFMLFL